MAFISIFHTAKYLLKLIPLKGKGFIKKLIKRHPVLLKLLYWLYQTFSHEKSISFILREYSFSLIIKPFFLIIVKPIFLFIVGPFFFKPRWNSLLIKELKRHPGYIKLFHSTPTIEKKAIERKDFQSLNHASYTILANLVVVIETEHQSEFN